MKHRGKVSVRKYRGASFLHLQGVLLDELEQTDGRIDLGGDFLKNTSWVQIPVIIQLLYVVRFTNPIFSIGSMVRFLIGSIGTVIYYTSREPTAGLVKMIFLFKE